MLRESKVKIVALIITLLINGRISGAHKPQKQPDNLSAYTWVFRRIDLDEGDPHSKIRFAVFFYKNGQALVMRKIPEGGWASYVHRDEGAWTQSGNNFTLRFPDIDDLVITGRVEGEEINASVTTTDYGTYQNRDDGITIPAPPGSKWIASPAIECIKPDKELSRAIPAKVALKYFKKGSNGKLTTAVDGLHHHPISEEYECN